jgi:Domain of unknown function (DUF5666)
MKTIIRFKALSVFLVAAYLLAACGGTLPQVSASTQGPKVQANVVAFTGIVESIAGSEWTVGGQKISLAPQVSLDPNIAVGDTVKVEANVLAGGDVMALKVEAWGNDDVSATASPDASSTPDPLGTPSPDASSMPGVVSSPGASTPSAPQPAQANEVEVFGMVEALTANTITVNGLTYNLASFTEFKDPIVIGDQVKLHVMSNPDGTLSIRELEKSVGFSDDNSNSSGDLDDSSNDNSSDDNSNHNSNDDSADDDSTDNGDDHGGNRGSGDDH